MFLEKIKLKWKNFFSDTRRTLLFISLAVMLPLPNFYLAFMGFLPLWKSSSIALSIMFSNVLALLIGAVLLPLHLLIFGYALRFVVNIIDKLLSFLPSNIVKNFVIATLILIVAIIVWNNNLFEIADVGGGLHKGNFADVVNGKF